MNYLTYRRIRAGVWAVLSPELQATRGNSVLGMMQAVGRATAGDWAAVAADRHWAKKQIRADDLTPAELEGLHLLACAANQTYHFAQQRNLSRAQRMAAWEQTLDAVERFAPFIPEREAAGLLEILESEHALEPVVRWQKWLVQPSVQVWEACALMVDLDPDAIERVEEKGSHRGPTFRNYQRDFGAPGRWQAFNQALEDVVSAVSVDGPIPLRGSLSTGGLYPRTAKVSLADVVRYLHSIDTAIPEPLHPLLERQQEAEPVQPESIKAEPAMAEALAVESVADRNLRWAGLEVAEKAANPTRGAFTRVAKRIAELEGQKLDTVEAGIRAGRDALAELTRQGKAPKAPASPAFVFDLAKHSGKARR